MATANNYNKDFNLVATFSLYHYNYNSMELKLNSAEKYNVLVVNTIFHVLHNNHNKQ